MEDLTTIQPVQRAPLALRSEISGELFTLSGEMLVGREVECDIQLASLQISRYHAKLLVSANGVFVEDLQSSNGTFVNGKRAFRRTLLKLGDQIAFDDLVFRVTTAHSGREEYTQVAAPNPLLSRGRVQQINSIAGDKLKPVAEDSAEIARARMIMANRQQAKGTRDDAPPRPASAKPQVNISSQGASLAETASAARNAPPHSTPPRSAPYPNASAEAASPSVGTANGDHHRGGFAREPFIPDIPDMEEFLKFAGSGLKAQEPLSKKDASPFGLAKSKPSVNHSRGGEPRAESSAAASEPPTPAAAYPPSEPRRNNPAAVLPGAERATDRAMPLEGQVPPHSAPPKPTPPKPAPPKPAPPKPALPKQAPAARPAAAGAQTDDDQTRYISLSTMDRYVETNARYQNDLDAGSGPRLIAMTAPIRGKVFELASGEDVKCWSIGRDDSADICIRDKVVSREHAWITKLDACYQLRVNEEASEILINGLTCTETDLKHGDRLQFGAMELVFRLDFKPAGNASSTVTSKGFLAKILGFFGRS